MWFKHPAWIPIAWLLSLANVAAVWFAAQPAEPWHATTHAALAVLFGLGAQHLSRRNEPASGADANADVVGMLRALETRLANPEQNQLAQALDSIAVEVERIGEGQRYLTKLIVERDAPSAGETGAPATPPRDSKT